MAQTTNWVNTRAIALEKVLFFEDHKPPTPPKGLPKSFCDKLPLDLVDVPLSDQELFLSTTLGKNDSHSLCFPLQKDCGTKHIPFSFFAATDKPKDAVNCCRKWRLLSQEQQEVFWKEHRHLVDSEKCQFQANLCILCSKKREMMRGSMTWDQANGDDSVAHGVDETVPITPTLGRMSISQGSTPTSVALAVVNQANGAPLSPLARRDTNNAVRQADVTPSPPTAVEVDEPSSGDKENHIARLSAKSARDEAAALIEKKLKAGKRKSSESSNGLLQTGTMTVRSSVHQSQRALAKALDTMKWKERFPSAPQTTAVHIFMTEMKDPPHNGSHPLHDCTREKILVQVIAESPRDLKSCLGHLLHGLERKDHIELHNFFRDDIDSDTGGGIAAKVSDYIDDWIAKRNRPKNKPLTVRQVVDDLAEEDERRRAENRAENRG